MARGLIILPICRRLSYNARFFDLVFVSMVFAAQFLAIGCDPGMLIKQVQSPRLAGGTPEQNLKLTVQTAHRLIGGNFYAPQIDAVNVGRSPIRVVKVELRTQSKTYDGDSLQASGGKDSLTIAPGQTAGIGVLFHLDQDVWSTFFRHPADLVVYYQAGSEQRLAYATIVGTHLDGSR